MNFRLLLRSCAILAFSAGLLAACTERIDIDTGEMDDILVCYGTVHDTPSYQTVMIRSSASYFDTDYYSGFVGDARMTIQTASGARYEMIEYPTVTGYYTSQERIAAEPGEIRLELSVDRGVYPFGGDFVITDTVPPSVRLDSVRIEPAKMMGIKVYNILVYAQDPPGETNYYVFNITVQDENDITVYSSNLITRHILANDSLTDGEYMDGLAITTAISADYKGSNGSGGSVIYLSPGNRVTVQMSNVSEGYYRFLSQCQSSKNGTNPFFGGPPSNITSNIPGGAGYFTGFSATSAEVVVPEDE